ncbi:MAG: hypothetical protein U0X75_18005 [Acidobacteriota bacterium]
MKAFPLPFLVLFICCSTLSGLAQGRESVCHEHPKLLKDDKGKPVRLGYKQLKERATNCETVKLLRMVDANGLQVFPSRFWLAHQEQSNAPQQSAGIH